MCLLELDLPRPLPNGQVSFKSYLPSWKHFTGPGLMEGTFFLSPEIHVMFLVCLCHDFLLISCCCHRIVVFVNQLCYTFCLGLVHKKISQLLPWAIVLKEAMCLTWFNGLYHFMHCMYCWFSDQWVRSGGQQLSFFLSPY